MTTSLEKEPWRGLPARVADLVEPELDAVTEEILASIGLEVPEYARPLEGSFGRGIRTGVGEALRQFFALIRNPDAGRLGREVYVELGRGELRQGRTLDSLQAAYRVGARVAWRRIAELGRGAKLDPEVLTLLAEAIFAYIDELSADSVEGYTEAQSEVESQRQRRRRELAMLLMQMPAVEAADLRAAAQKAGWAIPRSIAALACADGELAQVARQLPPDVLSTQFEETGCVLISDPKGPRRFGAIERASGGCTLALGSICTISQVAESWSLAKATLRGSEAGALPSGKLICAEDHLTDLLLFEGSALVSRIAARRLAPLDGLTEKARERMRETALAYVRHGGNAVAMADELQVHPQTARYRVGRLGELLGDQLDDPNARLELELALRR